MSIFRTFGEERNIYVVPKLLQMLYSTINIKNQHHF